MKLKSLVKITAKIAVRDIKTLLVGLSVVENNMTYAPTTLFVMGMNSKILKDVLSTGIEQEKLAMDAFNQVKLADPNNIQALNQAAMDFNTVKDSLDSIVLELSIYQIPMQEDLDKGKAFPPILIGNWAEYSDLELQ